jgi:uncharacterized repeat protein (TIGR03803 family)
MKKYYLLSFALVIIGISNAQFTDLYYFNNNTTSGANPNGTLALSGNVLYGMTEYGGQYSNGSIFCINTDGSGYRDLFDFNGTSTGKLPLGSVTLIGNKLYGMARGGAFLSGIIFSIDTDGNGFNAMFNFNGSTGNTPCGSLTQVGGLLYGMTNSGGTKNWGTIFSIDTSGSGFRTLYSFDNTHGGDPQTDLLYAGTNKLYGMTTSYGANGIGCIFSVDTSGNDYLDMHDFVYATGGNPYGDLTLIGGKLYGMPNYGGLDSMGCIFSIDTSGTGYKDILAFNGVNGEYPAGTLAYSVTDGLIYGMTTGGGADSVGNIFTLDTNGTNYTDIFDFDTAEGVNPAGSVILTGGNTIYGMTNSGGSHNNGTIFRLKTIITSINGVSSNSGAVKIYPNPSNGMFTFELKVNSEKLKVEVYNIMGEKVYSQYSIANAQFSIDLNTQPAGIYFYRITDKEGASIGSGKLVIQK